MPEYAIETAALRREFGRNVAVAGLSLAVPRGEVFGFLGPNGAGKTTSLKLLLGLVAPTSGSGTVLGAPLGNTEVRARIGFLPEHFRFHDCLNARELLYFHGRLLGLPARGLDTRIEALLLRVGLDDAAHRPLRTYSKGMVQRAGLAAALLGSPELVFLDEPTSGLDPLGRLLVRDVIDELRAGGASVFLNSHLLGEVEATCDRVAFVKNGRRRARDEAREARRARSTSSCASAASTTRCSKGSRRSAPVSRATTRSCACTPTPRACCRSSRAGSSAAASRSTSCAAAARRSRNGSSRSWAKTKGRVDDMRGTLLIARLTWLETRRRRIALAALVCGLLFLAVFASAIYFGFRHAAARRAPPTPWGCASPRRC